MSWAEVPLTDAYWFQEGPGLRKWQFTSEGVKVLNVGNIMPDGSIDLSRTDRHISLQEFESKYSHFGVDEGDLVIASSGISFDEDGFLRTKVAFIDNEHLPLCMNTSTIRFKAIDGKSDLRFLRHWFQSYEFRKQVSQLVTGSAQKNFGPSHLKAMTIYLPPLDEQKRIAAILDQADELRRKRQRAIDRLGQLGQAIFHDMFGDATAQTSVAEYLDNVESGKSLAGVSDTDDAAFRVLKISAVNRNGFRPQETKPLPDGYEPPQSHLVKNGDLIFSRANTTELVGIPCIVEGVTSNVALPDKLWRLVPNLNRASKYFLNFALRASNVREQIQRMCSGTSGSMKNISMQKFKTIALPEIGIKDQRQFSDRIGGILELQKTASVSEREVEKLFASLQHRAFRGEL